MKKLTLLFAALVLSFTAQAAIINGTPNPGEKGRLNWWVNGVVESIPVTQPGDTIVLADGEYEEGSIDFNKEGLVVMAAEGAKPVIKASSYIKIHANTTFIGITFDGLNTADYALTSRGTNDKLLTLENCKFLNYKSYYFSGESSTNISLKIEDCVFDGAVESVNTTKAALFTKGIVASCTIEDSEFKNFAECAITVEKWYGGRFDALTINDCLIHDCTQSAIYLPYAIDTNEKQTCSDFKLTNSTIYNIGNGKSYGAIDIQGNSSIAPKQQSLIDHVTLYNFQTSSGYGAILIENASQTTISNCILMNPTHNWIASYNVAADATIQNCIAYNCHTEDDFATILIKEDPMFVDAANGDFMLYAESPAVGAGTEGSNLGDPRWGVKAGIQPGEGKLKAAVDAAQPGATIVLGDETYEVSTSIEFDVEGLTIVAAEGTSPIIKLVDAGGNSSLKLSATTTFNGITFDGNNITKYPVTSTGTDANQFTFVNCEFKNYTKWAITNEYGSSHVDNVIIDKCLFHDGGSAVYFNSNGYNGQHSCSYFKMTNTTIYNINYDDWGVGVIHVSANGDAAGEQNEVEIDHITMYNVSTKEYGAITVRKSSKLSVTNSIIANPASNSNKYAFYIYGGNVTNTLYYNSKVNSEAPTMTTINKDPLFVNAAENNFDLYANSPAVGAGTNGSNLGDPRWNVSDKTIGTGKRVNVTTADVGSLPWIVNNAASNLQPGDTLVLADGQYTLSTIKFIKENVVVMAAEGATPEIISASEWANLEISANTTFDGITFNGNNVAQYLISIQDSTTMKTKLVLQNCELKNWKQWAISNQYSKNVVVDSLIIDNCLFHDGTNSAVYFSENAPEGKHACQDLKITNSTFYNIGNASSYATVYSLSNANAVDVKNDVTVDHCTFYNCQAKNTDHGAVRVSCAATISNTIIVAPESQGTYRAIYAADNSNAQAINCLTFNYEKDNGGIRSAASKTDCYLNTDPLFVDAANNNFMLQANSPAIGKATDGTNLGDPRWGVEEPELITLTTGDNDAVIAANKGKTVNVKIEREFKANDGYYTICVPFNMPAEVIGKAYSLGTITEHVSGEGININLKEENELSAGMPYLVLPKANMSELVVENVTIAEDGVAGQGVSNEEGTVKIFFQGYYSAGGQTDGSIEYYVGNNGYLYNEVVDIRGLCGLFTITDANNNPLNVRARVVTREDAATGLDNNQLPITNIQKAIENGQLIIIRDGVKYNVQGQKL